VQEVLVSKDEPQLAPYQVPRDKQEDGVSSLDDQEPIVAPFEPHAEFQEDEGEDLNIQQCSLVPPISENEKFQEDEKFQEEEPQVNQVEISQQGTSSVPILVEATSLPITTEVQEQLDLIPLQQEEPLLVQLEDDVPYTLPTILHLEVVLRILEMDQCLDIKVHHDLVELRMMEVFQQVDSKSFTSHAFTLVTVEIPCSKSHPTTFSQPIPCSYAFSGKYIKASLGHMRFHDWSPWKVDFVDPSRRIDHLASWLHWSFEYDDLTMAILR
jgi:hypothetical protein